MTSCNHCGGALSVTPAGLFHDINNTQRQRCEWHQCECGKSYLDLATRSRCRAGQLRSFGCPAPGCDYKSARKDSTKQHMRRRHPNVAGLKVVTLPTRMRSSGHSSSDDGMGQYSSSEPGQMPGTPLPVPLTAVAPPIFQPVQYTNDRWLHESIFYDTEASAQAPQVRGVRESMVENTVGSLWVRPFSDPPGIVSSAGALWYPCPAPPPPQFKLRMDELLPRGGISLPSSKHYMHPGSASTRTIEDIGGLAWIEFSTLVDGERGRYRQRSRNAVAYGGFSDVFLCDARLANGSSTLVAVKRLRATIKMTGDMNSQNIDQKLQKRLNREVKIWMGLQHTNIAPLLGFVLEGEVCIISPWFMNGNVAAYLETHPEVDRTELVKQVAEGVAYLHNRHPIIVHGDIKPDNILIDQDGTPKLIDFGLSKAIEADPGLASVTSASLRDAGNARWVAPELIFGEAVSRSCITDTFSFGCVGFFIFTEDVPFKDIPDTGLIIMRYKGAYPVCADYPDLDAHASLKNALWLCLERDPDARPTMSAVVQLLKQTI